MRHFRHEIKSLFRRIGGFIPLSMAFKVQVKELQNSCILRVSIFTPCKPIDDDDNNNIVTEITLFWTLFYIYIYILAHDVDCSYKRTYVVYALA